jgi:hypothetical protein
MKSSRACNIVHLTRLTIMRERWEEALASGAFSKRAGDAILAKWD